MTVTGGDHDAARRSDVYDSAHTPEGVRHVVDTLTRNRRLIAVLTRRDLIVRSRRSFLGVGWTFLNPLLTVLVMWAVFAHFFGPSLFAVPYIIYLLSGVILFNFVAQGVQHVGATIINGDSVLSRIRIPAELLASAAGLSSAINWWIAIVPMLVLQLLLGVGIPVTALLAAGLLALLLVFTVGLGLVIAAAAVRFPDTLGLTVVGFQLLGYLTPTFYPLALIPHPLRLVIELNPLTHFLTVFRALIYEGQLGPPVSWLVVVAVTAVFAWCGCRLFTRAARFSIVAAGKAA